VLINKIDHEMIDKKTTRALITRSFSLDFLYPYNVTDRYCHDKYACTIDLCVGVK